MMPGPLAVAGQVYRWTDADGVPHYGDRSPAEPAGEVRTIPVLVEPTAIAGLRIEAAVSGDIYFWSTLAAFGWLLAFTPWVSHFIAIYFSPRRDGRPG